MPNRFSISKHIPKYSTLLLKAFRTPLLVYFTLVGNVVLLLSASLFYHFERPTNKAVTRFFDAIWWAFSTVTTVGYGDVTPITIAGRITGLVLMIFGVLFFLGFTASFFSIIFSLVASEIMESEQLTMKEFHAIMKEIQGISEKLTKLEREIAEKHSS